MFVLTVVVRILLVEVASRTPRGSFCLREPPGNTFVRADACQKYQAARLRIRETSNVLARKEKRVISYVCFL